MPGKSQGLSSRRSMILEAAKDLFFERSFAAVGVDEIGERAGVTGPAIYRHFRGKDEILSTLFGDALDRLMKATDVHSDDPWAELGALALGHAEVVVSERELAGVEIREGRALAEPYRRRLRQRERRYLDRWVACLQRCYPDRDRAELATLAQIALGALNAVAMWSSEAAKTASPETITAVVLRGLHAFEPVPVES